MLKLEKFKNIEFFRIFFIICIALHHGFIKRSWSLFEIFPDISLFTFLEKSFRCANNGVEAFFIMAGFFLLLTFNPNTLFKDFVIKKYIRLAPVIIFATLLCGLASVFKLIDFNFFNNVLTMLLLNNFVIRWSSGCIGSVWYVSALFAAFMFYFLILKYTKNEKVKLILISFFTILGYGILLYLKHGSFGGPAKNFGIFNVGFLRAIGGVGLGILIGYLYKLNIDKIKNFIPNLSQKIYITSFEVILFLITICWVCCKHSTINNLVFVIAFSFLFILFIMKKGFLSILFEKDYWSILGRYSYSIFVTHTMIYKLFSAHFWVLHRELVVSMPFLPVIVNTILIVLLGVLTYILVEKPSTIYLKKLLGYSH